MKNLEQVRELREQGAHSEYVDAARALAEAQPSEVDVQIEAAYACDRYGTEENAVVYYDAAWALGVPGDRERNFLVGYGSTLRNVGRSSEATELLATAVERYPDFAPLHLFRALALHAVGQHDLAMAAAMTATLLADNGSGRLDKYVRAITAYRDELAIGKSSAAPTD